MEMVHFIPSGQRRLALMAAQTDSAPILICGGAGTGKGAIAHWLHLNGPRVGKPFLVIQENSISERIREAQGGTLVITEVAELPLGEQKTLLGFLNQKAIPDPKTGMPQLVNTRIIATTSHDLERRAQGGLFNIELLDKLKVFHIEMPPLSKRTEEFEDIVLGFTKEITQELHKEYLQNLSADCWAKLKAYDWPGNLRELRNVLRLAVSSAKGDQIEISDLPDFGYTRIDFRATREQFEKIYFLELLKTFNWEIEKTCKMARIEKSLLLSKLKHYGIVLENRSIS